MAQNNESEPNNTYNSSDYIKQDSSMSAALNAPGDANDYFSYKVSRNSTVKIVVNATNIGSSNSWLYIYIADSRKGNGVFYTKYISNNSNVPPNGNLKDTIVLYGRGADSMFLRFETGGNFSYSIKYFITDTYTNDKESNNTFDLATPFTFNSIDSGMLKYSSDASSDVADVYKTKMPYDGTVRIIVETINKGGSNSYVYFSAFDSRKSNGNFYSKYVSNNSNIPYNQKLRDTIYLYSREADSLFLKFESSLAYHYNFSVSILDTSTNDLEKNNSFSTALDLPINQTLNGHIGYINAGTRDGNDYYKFKTPINGTLKLMTEAMVVSGSNSYLYIQVFDKRKSSGNILNKYQSNNSNLQIKVRYKDTIYMYGLRSDSFFISFSSGDAVQYSIKYSMIDTISDDLEPNNSFSQYARIDEYQVKSGNIRYFSNGTSDAEDIYGTLLKKDGTLKIYASITNLSGANSYLYLECFDARKANGNFFSRYVSNNSNISAFATMYDTIYLNNRASDSMFFKFTSGGAFKYQFKYEIIDTSVNDIEPNNGYASATVINSKTKYQGHLGFIKNGVPDASDFYRINTKRDGTLKLYLKVRNVQSSNSYFYISVFDGRKGSGNFYNYYMSNNSSLVQKTDYYDTITLKGRAADSTFIQFSTGGGFHYDITYELVDTVIQDKEPNRNFSNATSSPIGLTKYGNLGYSSSGQTDNDDYFASTAPNKGTLNVIVSYTNYGAPNSYCYISIFDKRKGSGNIYNAYLKNNFTLQYRKTLVDTFKINCYGGDSFFVKFNTNTSIAYSVKFEYIDRTPKANLEYEQLGNTIGFRSYKSNATGFDWSFGDNTTSNLQYPIKTYKPGGYIARFIASNNFCGFKDTASTIIKVQGIEYYTPNKGGAGGDVSIQVYGGGLTEATSIKLVQNSIVLNPVDKFVNTLSNRMTAIFDLHFATEGDYDVIIQLPGDTATVYKKGFKIEKIQYPYTYSSVQGPSRMRNNTDNKFSLVVGNKGNIAASGVVLALVWPQGITINFKDKFIKPPKTGNDTLIIDGDPKTYTLPYADYAFIYDSLNTITPIDSFEGKPYKGYIRYLLIPHVPANATVEFPFTARSTTSQNSSFYTFTHKPNLWGSCPTGNYSDFSEDLTAELIDGADMLADKSKNPFFKAFTKTAKIGQKHGASAATYLGKHFWAWYDGYEVDENEAMGEWLRETEANNAYALQTATDELGNFMLDKGIGKLNETYQKQVDFINKTLANNKSMSPKMTEAYINVLNKLTGDNKRLNKLKEIFDASKNLKTLDEKIAKIKELTADCPELAKQLEDLLKNADKELDHQDVSGSPILTANSFDPNEINGPIGIGIDRHIGKSKLMRYVISFENVDTASAAAQIVYIKDTLDKNKYNLNTFEFGDFTIGTNTYRVPKGRKEFVMEITLSSLMKVRVNGRLDVTSGIITWQFTSIDPLTGDLPIFEGFLPPNKSKPEGEGSVSFTVGTIVNIPHATVISNKADIVFDDNAAIITNTWTNIIDTIPPSSLCVAKRKNNSSNIILTYNGNDNGSGINYYDLYIQIDGGPWIAFGGGSSDTQELIADFSHVYSFCAIAKDNVGNVERKNLTPETTLDVNSQSFHKKYLILYPNPSDGIVKLKGEIPSNAQYNILDINGKLLRSGYLTSDQISIEDLNSGMYLIQISDEIETVTFKVAKL